MLIQQNNRKRDLALSGLASLSGLQQNREAANRAAKDQARAGRQAAIGQGAGLIVGGLATGNPLIAAAGVLSLF